MKDGFRKVNWVMGWERSNPGNPYYSWKFVITVTVANGRKFYTERKWGESQTFKEASMQLKDIFNSDKLSLI